MDKLPIIVAAIILCSAVHAEEYLGNLSANPYAPDSTSNPYSAGSPYDPNSVNNRGIARSQLNDLDGAYADLSKAIALASDWSEPYLNRSKVERRRGKPNSSLQDLNRFLVLNPSDADGWYLRGDTRMLLKDRSGAIGDWKQALKVAPPGWEHRAAVKAILRKLTEDD